MRDKLKFGIKIRNDSISENYYISSYKTSYFGIIFEVTESSLMKDKVTVRWKTCLPANVKKERKMLNKYRKNQRYPFGYSTDIVEIDSSILGTINRITAVTNRLIDILGKEGIING